MTVKFILRRYDRQNYIEENIIDIISGINDPIILEALNSPNERIQVHGPVHRTQLTSDNPEHYFWIRFSVHDDNNQIIPNYGGVHVFLCYQLWQWRRNTYRLGNCITPPAYTDHVDIANVEGLLGFWKPIRYTLGIQNVFQQVKTNTPYKPREKKPFTIINPKTGKKVE